MSASSTAPSLQQEGQHTEGQIRSSSLLSPDIPILIEPCDRGLIYYDERLASIGLTTEEGIPLNPLLLHQADNGSGQSLDLSENCDSPPLVKQC